MHGKPISSSRATRKPESQRPSMLQNCVRKVSEEDILNVPPPLRKRLTKILTDHAEAILYQRASVVWEHREEGAVP